MPDTREVYAAEDLFAGWLDEAARTPGEPLRIQVGGTLQSFEPETEPRFTDPAHVQEFVDRVLAHLVATGSPYDDGAGLDLATVPVVVRARRGHAKAHYEYDELPSRGVVAIPPREVGG